MNCSGHEGGMGCGVKTYIEVASGWHQDGIGMLEAGLCTGESFNVAITFFLEVGLEIGHGLLHGQLVFPLVDGSVEYACFDK